MTENDRHSASGTRGGDLLQAYDDVAERLAADPGNLGLRYRAVLILARAGATQRAEREYQRLGLADVRDDEDTVALGGRLLKDLALAARGAERRDYAKLSAARYAEAFALRQGYYPGINTATMTLIAGERSQSKVIAEQTLRAVERTGDTGAQDAYYRAATAAEALVLLGRSAEAEESLAKAIACDPKNFAAHATTLRQLGIIARELDADAGWLERHRPPPAVMFCGHIFDAEPPGVRAAIAAKLDAIRPSAVFGALAAGADTLIAEAALARGIELHVVLPMREDEFLRRSVAPFGADALQRYHACRGKAATFRLASGEPDMSDDVIFAFASELAMGLAVRHAEALETHAHQIAVWDGQPAAGVAGTAADVARWRATGRPQAIIAHPAREKSAAPPPVQAQTERCLKAMLFGDVRGFSRLDESHMRPFVSDVLGPLAGALRAAGPAPDLIATWGDGIHMVYDGVGDAAEAAIAAQTCFANLALGPLPPHLALRIGGHVGPVASLEDPFRNAPSFYGTHITIAARIEPVAAPGTIYVSEPFAALLALRAPGRFRCEYLGQCELPKQFGTMRLFSLRAA